MQETDNLKLQELFEADQSDRQRVYDTPEAVKDLHHRDAMRRTLIGQMIQNGEVSTTIDLYRAALVFQHGNLPKDYMTAHRLASMAAINGHKQSRWLMAASLDRFLMALGQPQIYGTQFEQNFEEGKFQLRLPIDDAGLLSFEKKFFNVPPVNERLTQLNGKIGG
jgi:TPR repeat protein